MDNLATLLRRVIRFALWFMFICAVIGMIFPDLRPYAFGLIVGTIASVISAWNLGSKTEKFTQQIIVNTKKRMGLGFTTRIFIVLIATIIAYRAPMVDLIGMVIGLTFVPLTTIVVGIFTNSKEY
ncbi:MAG: ATP synthase subunit I [Gorillibacterium sp.]|nr:ATP synthase subunit I [Gorillibacterium sp.]